MPRRGSVPKRKLIPDVLYQDEMVARLINTVMERGKKTAAEKICYGAFEIIHEKTKEDPLKVFNKALNNVKPMLEVKPRRVGGATYQVPVEVRPDRKLSLSIRWLVRSAAERGKKQMKSMLADEILDAAENRGGAIKKKEEVHKMAAANKAFAHYRW